MDKDMSELKKQLKENMSNLEEALKGEGGPIGALVKMLRHALFPVDNRTSLAVTMDFMVGTLIDYWVQCRISAGMTDDEMEANIHELLNTVKKKVKEDALQILKDNEAQMGQEIALSAAMRERGELPQAPEGNC